MVSPRLLRSAATSVLSHTPRSSRPPIGSFLNTAAPPPDHAVPDPSRPTHFGFQTVTEGEKRERVAHVFTSVAESYDRMNDVMSFGLHRVWKDHFVASLNPGFYCSSSLVAPQRILDVAGGTGDIAFRLLRTAHVANRNPDVHVTITDINPAMLAAGRQRSLALPAAQQAALTFAEANAEDLTRTRPLSTTHAEPAGGIPDDSVDLYTVAFGIRNFSNMAAALREAYRVLRPGGVFACMEFSPRADGYGALFAAAYQRWSFSAIPLLGQLVAGDRDSYQYLVESIARFPDQPTFRSMIEDAGFLVAGKGYEDLTGGVVAIHKGLKPRDGRT